MRKRFEYILAGLAAAAAFLVYLPALGNRFVWDDHAYILYNPHIHSLNLAFLKWAFTGFHKAQVGNWIPVTMVSYAMDYRLWGLDPGGYHLSNIILHAFNTFIVVLLAARLAGAWENKNRARYGRDNGSPSRTGRGGLIAAAATGLLFGLHPLHVESVAWAAERKDVLCGLFYLLALMAYLGYAERKGVAPGAKKRYLLALFLFALALMSKPMAVSLPLVLLLLDWFPLGRWRIDSTRGLTALLWEKLPFFILSGADSALALLAQKKGGAVLSFKAVPLPLRLLVAARSLVLYLWKMVFPVDLVPYYPYPGAASFFSPGYLLPVLGLAAMTAFCLYCARKGGRDNSWLRLFPACLAYFAVTILPVAGLVQVGGQAMADRYTYLPGLGPFMLMGAGAAWIWKKAAARKVPFKAAALASALIAALSMSYLTVRQTGIWKNGIVFWSYVIEKEPDRIPDAYNNLGIELLKTGQLAEAVACLKKAEALGGAKGIALVGKKPGRF